MKQHLGEKATKAQNFIFHTAMLLELVVAIIVAREMIIEHMPIYFTLIGIMAIAILFLIRKFLFVSALDKEQE